MTLEMRIFLEGDRWLQAWPPGGIRHQVWLTAADMKEYGLTAL
jgi:hypothetical protein